MIKSITYNEDVSHLHIYTNKIHYLYYDVPYSMYQKVMKLKKYSMLTQNLIEGKIWNIIKEYRFDKTMLKLKPKED
jgi:hypothetical protein